jgi:hypothetical protein
MTAILEHKQLSQLSMLTDKILGNPLIDTSDDNVKQGMRLEAFVSFHIGCVVISRLMEGILVFSSREITFYSKKLLVHTHYALVRELRPLPLSGV